MKIGMLLISGMLLLRGEAFAQQYTSVPIDVLCDAGAITCPAGLVAGQVAAQTSARGINARGDVVGFYVDSIGRQHGFLLTEGRYATIDVPGSLANTSGSLPTIANGINPQGEIVGQYNVPVNSDPTIPEDSPLYCPRLGDPACIKAFFYRHGKFSAVRFPATINPDGTPHLHPGAIAQRITPDGDIYGCLHDHDLGLSMFGAEWGRFDTRSLTADGGELTDPMPVPMSMNNGATPGGRVVVGLVVDMANHQHGYVVQDGALQVYDPTAATNLTAIWDINPAGQFVGTYRAAGEPLPKRHGFLQNPDGAAPFTFDISVRDAAGNPVVAFSTIAFGINPDSVIVGQYTLVSGGPAHGFVAFPNLN